jgi:hypothetical protein
MTKEHYKRLLALMDKIAAQNPHMDAKRRLSLVCARSPALQRFFHKLVQDGWSRDGAMAQMRGALVRWSDGE